MFAKVIVDIATSQVDKVFDYEIPKDMEAKQGYRVLVPFGKRQIEGFVIDIVDSSDLEKSIIKPISKIIDGEAVITNEQMEIARFLKSNYHIGYADSFKLFLPVAFRNGKVKTLYEYIICLVDDTKAKVYQSKLRQNAKNMQGLINYLLENGSEKQSKLSVVGNH